MIFEDWVHCLVYDCPCERIGEDLCRYEHLAERLDTTSLRMEEDNKTEPEKEDS